MIKLFCLLTSLLLSTFVSANFSISPMNQELSPKEKTVSYTLENLSNETTGYEIKVTTRIINKDGSELREPTKELRVFPSKIILKAGQKKRIKAMYLGSRNIENEKAFRVIFSQSDLKVTEESDSGLNTKYEFITALYVTPEKAEAKIKQEIITKNGKTWLALNNVGSKHQVLKSWTLSLVDNNGNKTSYDKKLPDMNLLSSSKVFLELEQDGSIPIKSANINY